MRTLYTRIGQFVEARPGRILAATLVLIVLALVGVVQLHIETSQAVFVNQDSDAAKNSEAYAASFGSDPIVVMIPGTSQDLTSPDTLAKIKAVTDQLTGDPYVHSIVSVQTLLDAVLKLKPLPEGVSLDQPGVATSYVFDSNGKTNSYFTSLFPTGNELVEVVIQPNLTVDQMGKLSDKIQDAVKSAGLPADTIVAGNPRLYADIVSSIIRDIAVTGVVAVLLMIVVLYLVFPVRRRLMALPVVVIGAALTFGIVGFGGMPLTLVTMAGVPILLGLGMDFAIQFHNRYEEELARGETPAAGLIDALTHIGPAVGIAVLATILGFMTLWISAVPAVRDFGTLLALGVAVLYCVALVVLNAVLYRFDKGTNNHGVNGAGNGAPSPVRASRLPRIHLDLSRYLVSISSVSMRFGWLVLLVGALLALGGLSVDHFIPVQTDIEKLVPGDSPGVVAINKVMDATGSATNLQFLVTADNVTSSDVLTWMNDFETRQIQNHHEIVGAESLTVALQMQPGSAAPSTAEVALAKAAMPDVIWSSLVNSDCNVTILSASNCKAAAVVFSVTSVTVGQAADLIDSIQADANPPVGVSVVPAGSEDVTATLFHSLTSGRLEIAIAGFLAVFIGLLLVHRSWRRAVVPVVPIVLVTGWSSGAMWLLGIELNPLTAVMSALIVGIGTEFSVLLVERYWEELTRVADRGEAMREAVRRIGRAIAASGLTVCAGFAALLASSFPVLREFGAVTVIDVLLALVATVVIVPPLAEILIRHGPAGNAAQGGGEVAEA